MTTSSLGPIRIGMDIGGTKIEAVAIDEDGVVRGRLRRPTGFGAAAVIASAAVAMEELEAAHGIDPARVESVGIGIPGIVDNGTGRVRHSVNLGIEDLPLRAELESILRTTVSVDNDVDVAALGAAHVLGMSGSLAYLNVGTGLAAGFATDGVLLRGAGGVAGEVGHIPADPFGEPCGCGQRGCLETVASGTAIRRMWPSADPFPALELFSAAASGDGRALEVRDRFLAGIAAAIRMIVLTNGVERVVIGGGLSNLGAPLLDGVSDVLRTWASESPLLESLAIGSRIRLLGPDSPVAAIGAALAAHDETARAARPTL